MDEGDSESTHGGSEGGGKRGLFILLYVQVLKSRLKHPTPRL